METIKIAKVEPVDSDDDRVKDQAWWGSEYMSLSSHSRKASITFAGPRGL
jgi:hypothetical protein